jgi:SCY1-like protein 1
MILANMQLAMCSQDDGSPVSVFEFNASGPGKQRLQPLAKNALRKLRTVRHPDVLKFLDAVETDSTIHIMTERVSPLSAALQDRSGKSQKEREDWLLWGLHRITVRVVPSPSIFPIFSRLIIYVLNQVALAFVNDAAASTHGNVCVNSVFITPSGEWKLGGFELLSNPKDMNEAAVLYVGPNLICHQTVLNPVCSASRLRVACFPILALTLHPRCRNRAGQS